MVHFLCELELKFEDMLVKCLKKYLLVDFKVLI